MKVKNVKIFKNARKLLSTVGVALMLTNTADASAHALDSDVVTSQASSIVETEDTITTYTRVEVSYSDSDSFETLEEATNKKKEYENKQEIIETEVESLGGEYDYTVSIVEKKGEETTLEFETDVTTEKELNEVIDDKKEEYGDTEIFEVDATKIIETEDLGNFEFDDNYQTEEEVQEMIDEKTEEVEKNGGYLVDSEITEEFVGSEIETFTVNLDGKTEEEIAKIITEYESQISDRCHVVVVRRILNVGTGEYETEIVKQTCESEEDALNKLKEMEEQGYIVDYSNIIQQRNEEKDVVTTTNGEIAYDTLEDAEIAKNEIEMEDENVKIVATIRKEIGNKEEITIDNKSFTTEEDAMAYLKSLEDAGYTIDNYDITTITENTGKVVEAEKVDESKTLYIFNAEETNFVLIKQASGHYAVWTDSELSDEAKQEFVDSYNENNDNNNLDGSTRNIDLSQITFIYGYDSFDLSSIGSQWGTYTFSVNENNLELDVPDKKISHAIFGYCVEKIKEFILNGTVSFREEEFYIDVERTDKGYDYIVEGKKEREIMNESSVLDVKIERDIYKFTGKASYEKEVDKGYKIVIRMQDIDYIVSTNGEGEIINVKVEDKEKSQVTPEPTKPAGKPGEAPRTADDNDLILLTCSAFGSLGGALSTIKILKKSRKENN